jgi:hypothetical protein
MKEALRSLHDAWCLLECYKSDPGIRTHGAFYAVDKAIKILEAEQEKLIFPNDKHNGLSLRDYYRGQVLAGICANRTHAHSEPKEIVERVNTITDAVFSGEGQC